MSNPIVDVVLDVGFESDLPAIGLIGTLLMSGLGYKDVKELPSLQLPEVIRKNDPNLKYQPLYEVHSENGNYKVAIGDGTFGVAICSSYDNWSNFSAEIRKVFTNVFFKSPSKIKRIGLRYVDIIDTENIFENGKIKVDIGGADLVGKKSFLNTEYVDNGVKIVQTIGSSVEFPLRNTIGKKEGSLVDIITAIEDGIPDNELEKFFYSSVERLHSVQRDLFKKVISDELISKLCL